MQDVNDELKKIKKKKHFYAYYVFIEKSSFMNFMNSNSIFLFYVFIVV